MSTTSSELDQLLRTKDRLVTALNQNSQRDQKPPRTQWMLRYLHREHSEVIETLETRLIVHATDAQEALQQAEKTMERAFTELGRAALMLVELRWIEEDAEV